MTGRDGGGLARATGLYTLSWSSGSAMGFILSGSLYGFGSAALVVVALAIGAGRDHQTQRPHQAALGIEPGTRPRGGM